MELDEEDSHLCIRCNQTIIGLQNYVNHRRRGCSSAQNAKPSTSFDFLNPHAEKKIENYADFGFGDERDDELGMSGRSDKPATSEQYKQYDYDFFSSLELQFMSKPQDQASGKNFNHRILTRKATAAIMAQNGDEWIDESAVGKKTDAEFKFFGQSESEDESDDSEPEVPRNYTRGKWKPGARPPNNFTGGKWKPEVESKLPNWDENESSNEANLDKSLEIDDSNPPPNHTKGKWVPGTKITKLEFKEAEKSSAERDNFWCSFCSRNLATRAIYERHLKSNLHVKRTKQQNDLEEAAEALPLTNLDELSTHFKQTPTSAAIKPDRAVTSTPTSNQESNEPDGEEAEGGRRSKKFRSRSRVTCEECEMKLPAHRLGLHLISHFHYRKMLRHPKKSFDVVLENFHKIIIQSPFQCQPCKFYFNTQEEFLRHWNSIRHRERIEGDSQRGRFLCSFCKFDCPEHDTMTGHLNSAEHQQVVALINRSKPIVIRRLAALTCNKCAQEFRYNLQLMRHLRTCEATSSSEFKFDGNFVCDDCRKAFQSALSLQKHKIKAHGTCIFFCSECQQTFKSADDAKTHRKTSLHKALVARKRMASDPQLKARLRKVCPICREAKLDVLELRAHILEAHPERKFSCGRCGMKFPLAQEVSRHVRDKACKFLGQTATSTATSDEKVPASPTRLGLHLIESNFADLPLPTADFTSNNDETEFGLLIDEMAAGTEQVVEVSFACKSCGFTSNSHAEFLFHEALHRVPLDQDPKLKLKCQICQRLFSKQSLREHFRQHTNERIFECTVDGCPMSFTRKNNLKSHLANVHRSGGTDKTTPTNVCRVCGKNFHSKYILEQHKFVHRGRIETRTFPCQLPSCIYVGRNATDTRAHLLTHSDAKLFICTQPNCDYRGQTMEQLRSHSRKHQELEFKFTCEHCDYKTKLSSHLKRHMRVHEREDGKIYKCPHCDYACNNSENLRKHVLKTNKHPGKFMYECSYCHDHKTNSMKEHQSHLRLAHGKTSKGGATLL